MRVKNSQKIVAVGGVILLIVGGIGALIYLKLSERGALFGELARYEGEEAAARAKIEQIPQLMEQRSKLVETIDRYAEILPPEEHAEHTAFVNILDGYRRDTQILIQKAEYVPLKETKGQKQKSFVRHRYRFKLLGSVPDFLEFVSKIENHKRFMKVDAFNIAPFGATGQINKSLSTRNDKAELEKAKNPLKEIDLTVSTYTYVPGKVKSVESGA